MLDMQLKGFYIKKIDYRFVTDEKQNAKFGYKIEKISDYSYELYLEFTFIDTNRDDGKILYLSIQMSALLDFSGDDCKRMNEEDFEQFIKNNGAAILFPYLRTLVHTITSFDTANEIIMLPVINIYELIKKIDNEKNK